ncbi:hypothetical protein V499_09048 [Pseudogymnoascus sp. VKM F-103]|nr:hypothetical protein V499_09048 [Pseudogymnoascus sp. VKM F-103]
MSGSSDPWEDRAGRSTPVIGISTPTRSPTHPNSNRATAPVLVPRAYKIYPPGIHGSALCYSSLLFFTSTGRSAPPSNAAAVSYTT